ncbi:MAG: hypothetical protein ACYC3I_20230 [Gemmataceae bacterium]
MLRSKCDNTLFAASASPTASPHQMNMEFSPQRLYYWIETLFTDYRKA